MILARISVIKKHALAFFCSISNPIGSSKKRDFKQSLSVHKASCMSPLAPLALPLWKLPTFQVWKTWVRPVSEGTASGFHPLWRFPLIFDLTMSKTSCPVYLEFNCLLLVTWIKLCLSQRNTVNHCKISPMPRGLGEMRKLQDISPPESHETILPLQIGPLFFFPKYSKLWSLPNLKVIKLEKQYIPLNAWSHAWLFFFPPSWSVPICRQKPSLSYFKSLFPKPSPVPVTIGDPQ